jgi:hypothetical protein
MTGGFSIARRGFLTIAGLTLAWIGFGRLGSLVMAGRESAPVNALGRRIVALLGCPESARVVGQAYLQRRPQEADVRLLVSSVIGDRALGDTQGLMTDPEALYRAVRAECQRDFEKGELVAIGGWYLARNEARMCGLAHML